MGCNGSSLNTRNNSSRASSGNSSRNSSRNSRSNQRPTICVVGGCKRPRQPATVCEEALQILDKEVAVKGFSTTRLDDDDDDNNNNNSNNNNNNFGFHKLCSEQERRLRSANLEARIRLGADSEEDEADDIEFAGNVVSNEEESLGEMDPKPSAGTASDADDALIPGMPNDLAQLCLMRIPFVKYDASLRLVSKNWRQVLSSEEFYTARASLKISETFISFIVHGNRVQIFNLTEHSWFFLPPLPRDRAVSSPERDIDPYEWWQIETVAASQGTLFVMGGDQATIYNCIRPTEPANTVHKYDYCKNQWIKVAPMQIPRSNSAAVALKRMILVAGGNEEMEEGASAEVYDPATNCWSFVSRMHSSMKGCVGVEHKGLIYVKGANLGSGSPIEGELYDPVKDLWIRMNPGLRRGLARGPIASANSQLFVADWKDSLLKMYVIENDSWEVVAGLPAKISRLVGHRDKLYGLTGKIKVDPYNHHVISDSPDGVWQLDLEKKIGIERKDWLGSVTRRPIVHEFDWRWEDNREVGRLDLRLNSETLRARMEFRRNSQRGRRSDSNSGRNMLCNPRRDDGGGLGIPGLSATSGNSRLGCNMQYAEDSKDYAWKCIWREPKQILKTGSLSWVPSSAHCALLED